jgi:osmotically-inducible protein OsmY
MHAKRSNTRQLVVMLAVLSVPGLCFTQMSWGFDQPPASSASSDASAVAPDNTAINTRDRNQGAVTPFTQSNDRHDVEITRRIRRALMEDKSLSTTAKNVKVVTAGGNVVLRGPVKSEHERAAIAHKALEIAGTGHVNDQLEIAGR